MAKVKTGIVVSNKMNNSVVVQIDRMVSHRLYGKRYRVSKKIMAHSTNEAVAIGDEVTIQETKPISKNKSWIVTAHVPAKSRTTVEMKPEETV